MTDGVRSVGCVVAWQRWTRRRLEVLEEEVQEEEGVTREGEAGCLLVLAGG